MPQRPKEHQLSEDSRKFFESAIPSHWVIRQKTSDYGIDFEIEIFDKSDASTGIIFYVQLKGTSTELKRNIASIVFKTDTGKYFHSLEIPVLIVLYHSPTKTLYSRWFHSFDPFYLKRGSKTFTFKMDQKHIWDDKTIEIIEYDLQFYKEFKDSHSHKPLEFLIKCKNDNILGYSAEIILSKLRDLTDSKILQFKIDGKSRKANLNIFLTEKIIKINIGEWHSDTLHNYGKIWDKSDIMEVYTRDILVGISITLSKFGRFDISIPLLVQNAANAKCTYDKNALIIITVIFIKSRNLIAAIDLAEKMILKVSNWNAGIAFISLILLKTTPHSDGERAMVLSFYSNCIKQYKTGKFKKGIASLHYNIGNYLMNTTNNNIQLVIHHFNRALKNDQEYCNRSYFCAEFGGALFFANRYKLSKVFYQQALSLGEEVRTQLADVLLHSGEYKEASKILNEYLSKKEKQTIRDCENRLKLILLNTISEFVDNQQPRNQQIAQSLFNNINDLKLEQKKAMLIDIIKYDALFPQVWYKLSKIYYDEGKYEEAFNAFISEFVLSPSHPELWLFSFHLIIKSNRPWDVLYDIIELAYRHQGENILLNIQKLISTNKIPDNDNELIRNLSSFLNEFKKPEDKTVIRMILDDEIVEEIEL